MTAYLAGSLITTVATFADDTGTPTDPDTVTLKYSLNRRDATTTVEYPDDAITKVSTGVYSAEIDTTGAPGGTAVVEWIGTGACQAIAALPWTVTPAPL